MRAYVEQTAEPGYDTWFREQVQAAIDDPRPSIPHDVVMERTRAIIDEIAGHKVHSSVLSGDRSLSTILPRLSATSRPTARNPLMTFMRRSGIKISPSIRA